MLHHRVIRRASTMLNTFVRDEAIGGKLVLFAAVVAMILANSSAADAVNTFWHQELRLGIGSWSISQSLLHWLNEGLMTIFFFVVGLEIRRELTEGELRNPRVALLPIAAALGGMAIPALLYSSLNGSSAGARGWGIPMATDIAFAVAALSLLGKRIPRSLKIFLLSLAIVDDVGAVIIIAIVYATGIQVSLLLVGAICVWLAFLLRKELLRHPIAFIAFALGLWIIAFQSGINASIIGVVLAMIVPHVKNKRKKFTTLEHIERIVLPFSTFAILPLFALANAGVLLSLQTFSNDDVTRVGLGIFLGLVVGKVTGITLAVWLLVSSGLARLPSKTTWRHIVGIGLLAGIGFTISIYMTQLAFGDSSPLTEAAKVSIFAASITSAILGYSVLSTTKTKKYRS